MDEIRAALEKSGNEVSEAIAQLRAVLWDGFQEQIDILGHQIAAAGALLAAIEEMKWALGRAGSNEPRPPRRRMLFGDIVTLKATVEFLEEQNTSILARLDRLEGGKAS